MRRRFHRFARLLVVALPLIVTALLVGVSPARAFRDGFQGWGGWNGSYDDPASACAEMFNQCKGPGGCQPFGWLGPNSSFLGARPLGPRSAACMWTTYQWGCSGGINNCGTALPPAVGSSCGSGYATRGFSSCYKITDGGSSSSCPGVGNPIMLSDGAKVSE